MSELLQLIHDSLYAAKLEQQTRASEALARLVIAELQVFLHVVIRAKPEVAEEALSEALRAIFKALPAFHGETDSKFWHWCHQIARNKACDEWRQPWAQRRETLDTDALWSLVQASEPDAPLAPGERLDLEYTLELVWRSKPPCYSHLLNYYILGWDYDEIATALGISYDAAKMTVRRCLELARALANKQG